MKYKIGDKVRYDGGDWWFYGTVSAAFEHSICPCYRLDVDRMEKKSCKFSITQFEFELEPCEVEIDSGNDKRKKELVSDQKLIPIPELAPEKKKRQKREPKQESETGDVALEKIQKKEPRMRKISDTWERNLESYRKGERSNAIYTWMTHNRKLYKTGKLAENKFDKLMEINFPFEIVKKSQ